MRVVRFLAMLPGPAEAVLIWPMGLSWQGGYRLSAHAVAAKVPRDQGVSGLSADDDPDLIRARLAVFLYIEPSRRYAAVPDGAGTARPVLSFHE